MAVMIFFLRVPWLTIGYTRIQEADDDSSRFVVTRWWQLKYFFFTPTWGDDPIWRAYVSNGLVQPPTRLLRYISIQIFGILKTHLSKSYRPNEALQSFLVVFFFFAGGSVSHSHFWTLKKDRFEDFGVSTGFHYIKVKVKVHSCTG